MAAYIVDVYQLQEIVVTKAMKGFQVIKVNCYFRLYIIGSERWSSCSHMQFTSRCLHMPLTAKMLVVVRLTGSCISK